MSTLCQMVKGAHDWKAEEKNSMRRLFEHALRTWPNLVVCLRETQGTLVMRAKDYNWRLMAEFDLELVKLTDDGKFDEAVELMADKLKQSMDFYFPDCAFPNYLQFLTEMSVRRLPQMPSESACLQPQ